MLETIAKNKGLSQYYPIPIATASLATLVGGVMFFLLRKKMPPVLQTWIEKPFQPATGDENGLIGSFESNRFDQVNDATPVLTFAQKGEGVAIALKKLFEKFDPTSAENNAKNATLFFEFSLAAVIKETRGEITQLKKALWEKCVKQDGTLTKDGELLLASGNRPLYFTMDRLELLSHPELFCSIEGDVIEDTPALWCTGENILGIALQEMRALLQERKR